MEEQPLENSWTFWEHRRGDGRYYKSNMVDLGTFNTVEGFWRHMNNIRKPSEIFTCSENGRRKFPDRIIEGYAMFKKGIRPEWEDKSNMNGCDLSCKQYFDLKELDDIYEKLLLGSIGEICDDGDNISGIRVIDKCKKLKHEYKYLYRVEIWFKHRSPKIADKIKDRFNEILGKELKYEYSSHQQSIKNNYNF